MWRAWLVTMIVAAAVPAGGADKVAPETTIGGLSFRQEVRVTVVNVDVYVRDGGKPVTGLTRGDFRLLQNGDEVPITNFAVMSEELIRSGWQATHGGPVVAAPTPAASAEGPTPEIKPVWVVLYIDNENINPLHRTRIMRRVRDFVIESLDPPVQMMVVSYERSLKVAQPFTSDSKAVTSALRDMKLYSGGRVERDNRRRELIEQITEIENQDHGSRDTSSSGRTGAMMRVQQSIMAFAKEEANDLNFTLSSINQVIGMLSGLEGRKSVIYVSSGLPMTPGIGLMHQYATTFHDNSIMSRRSQVDRTHAYRSLTTAANGQDVMLYTIDASGLNPLEGFSAEDRYGMDPTASSIGSSDYQAALEYMADATGGLSVINSNDIGPGLERIRDDLFTYYSLGFQIDSSGEDKVHRIEVEVPGHAGLDIRYRRSFIERSLESKVQDRVFSSLMVDVDDNPMDLRIETGAPAPASGDRWTVSVHLSFPLQSVALLPEGEDYVGRVVLFFGARADDGSSSEIQRELHEIRIPTADLEAAQKQRYGIDLRLLLEEGRQRIGMALMDEITRQAAFDQAVLRVP